MDKTRLQKYETMLLVLETKLQADIDQSIAEVASPAIDGRIGRSGDTMHVQHLAREVKRHQEERLQHVQGSLRRIQTGSYGLCGRCRSAIDTARLDAFPDVELCLRCASAGTR
jgi:RNA polymerase-binding transcription factor DksA